MNYRPIIGIEGHVQLNTVTKLFCRCLSEYIPEIPNKNICPFCVFGDTNCLEKTFSFFCKKFALGLKATGIASWVA